MQTDIKTIKLRLKKTKRDFQLTFLEHNESKIDEAYVNLKKISKLISYKPLKFKDM